MTVYQVSSGYLPTARHWVSIAPGSSFRGRVVAGTLTLAAGLKLKQDGDLGLIRGLYALCPGIGNIDSTEEESFSNGNDSGKPEKTYSSGILAYGIAEYENRNPLAWPGFAAGGDVRGLPPTMISVNEFDRNEGSIKFYRLLLSQGVPASCRQLMGTSHAVEFFPQSVPTYPGKLRAA